MERRQVLKAGGVAATAGLTGLAGCSSSNPDASGKTDTPFERGYEHGTNGH
ncbi:twin-arginine translocation signal domain-containing protein [Halovenus rubra]|jgi:hypothetical protein|uniref:Twin-arginine translocation signal domain-containing protein n=2 Tax=Halovenus rubra TaxID=869890 RepID=A0ABD5X9W9_9EURY|nr:twin-arginine translocation signal domain-containing protein [Halovenus rubra]